MEALKKELICHPELPSIKGRKLQSIYFGGGTPALVAPDRLTEILNLCAGLFDSLDNLEVTLESTPESIHPQKARDWLHAGINRLSIGAQSFLDSELKLLGRYHTPQETRRAVLTCRDTGLTNINLDLIYGLPGQSIDQWRFTLAEALALTPQHISCYGLTLEEGTLFHEFSQAGHLTLPDEEKQSEMYLAARALLLEHGFEQYEISNFAKPGYPCRHNLTYWSDGKYLGLGASAHSHLNGRRFSNCFDPQEYIQRVMTTGHAICEIEELPPDRKAQEAIAFGLRKPAGVNLQEILNRYCIQLPQAFYTVFKNLQAQGLVTFSSENLRLTPKGFLLADELASAVLTVDFKTTGARRYRGDRSWIPGTDPQSGWCT